MAIDERRSNVERVRASIGAAESTLAPGTQQWTADRAATGAQSSHRPPDTTVGTTFEPSNYCLPRPWGEMRCQHPLSSLVRQPGFCPRSLPPQTEEMRRRSTRSPRGHQLPLIHLPRVHCRPLLMRMLRSRISCANLPTASSTAFSTAKKKEPLWRPSMHSAITRRCGS
jgi:hypothetical protein